MRETNQDEARDSKHLGRVAIAVLAGAVGILMAHWPMIASGFRRLQVDSGDRGDTRLVHYLLEHGYRWLVGVPGHEDVWSPPFFYPARNVAAYSDTLLGVMPFYAFFRRLGAGPDLAFGLWMVEMSALNYAAALLLFRRGLRFGIPATVSAAYLVTFGAPRLEQLDHAQLLPCFFLTLPLLALVLLFRDSTPTLPRRFILWGLFALGITAQFYSGVYLGWFFVLALGIAMVLALAFREARSALLRVAHRDAIQILVSASLAILMLWPLAAQYRVAARERQLYLPMLRILHPDIFSWFQVGEGNLLWGWTAGLKPFRGRAFAIEHRMGMGVLTPLACTLGLYLGRPRPLFRMAMLVIFLLWALVTLLPSDALCLFAFSACCYALAALFRDRDWPEIRYAIVGLVVAVFWMLPFPSPDVRAVGLVALGLCFVELVRTRDRPGWRAADWVAVAALSVALYPADVWHFPLAVAAPLTALSFLLWPTRRKDVALVAAGLSVLFSCFVFDLIMPDAVTMAAFALPLAIVAAAMPLPRPTGPVLFRVVLVVVPILILFYHQDSLWFALSPRIPGAIGIRAIGRVALILLYPFALGLAFLVDRLASSGRAAAAWLLTAACMAEQAVRTESYDAAENRASIAALAGKVDRGRPAFYYRPCTEVFWPRFSLDAMWASLETGVPTVDGYSGYAPPDWSGFNVIGSDGGKTVREALTDWERKRGLPEGSIQWIGEDCPKVEGWSVPPRRPERAPAESEGAGSSMRGAARPAMGTQDLVGGPE